MSVWLSPLCFVFHFLIETEYLHAACMEIYCAFKLFFFFKQLFTIQQQQQKCLTEAKCRFNHKPLLLYFRLVLLSLSIVYHGLIRPRVEWDLQMEGLSLSCCVGYKVMPHRCGWMRNLNWITCIVCGKIGWNSLSTTSVLYFRTHPQLDVVCGGPSNGWKSN